MNVAHALLLSLSIAGVAHAQAAGEVRIYRCTDAAGKQTLRDTPCPKGQQQQARDMLRPKDAPPRPAPNAQASEPPRQATMPMVYLAPPRPMYECVTGDGHRYTSDTGDGDPRWVPLWTLGYSGHARPDRLDASRGSFRRAPAFGSNVAKPESQLPTPPTPPPLRPHRPPAPWAGTGAGTWIRDACTLLPPQDTCARLRDRREAIRTRFFNAMPSERDVLRVEERGINARLANDCGGR